MYVVWVCASEFNNDFRGHKKVVDGKRFMRSEEKPEHG